MKFEHTHALNASHISTRNISKNQYLNMTYNTQLYNFYRSSFLTDEFILINSHFQAFTSLIICIISFMGTILHIKILIRHYVRKKSFPNHIFKQTLFDMCHLINIWFTHSIIIVVYVETLKQNTDLYCPLSAVFFSLASFGFIILLCLEAFHRCIYFFKKQSQRRRMAHRLLAHKIILVTSISWLILSASKINLN
ncbi:unnamed protein product [Rotaria magnacalcarata]|uniref:G-protein coupled receptors family 1 profile domain-containing protein n=1 Tax=Rotaria magnacalcarata TaxID=392030 RepID=A0A816RHG9_9BILA|nr:unnamed protein product [Rotaria magnacalcarata]CAF3732147.1 unnamed protein product [Rotaria magnacalcarata]